MASPPMEGDFAGFVPPQFLVPRHKKVLPGFEKWASAKIRVLEGKMTEGRSKQASDLVTPPSVVATQLFQPCVVIACSLMSSYAVPE